MAPQANTHSTLRGGGKPDEYDERERGKEGENKGFTMQHAGEGEEEEDEEKEKRATFIKQPEENV